jgi:hypothetical protein
VVLATPRTNPRGVYSYQWNAQVEYRLAKNLALAVGYLGVRGLNLSSATARNVVPASLRLATGEIDYAIAPGIPVPRVFNPLVASLSLFTDTVGQSNYHSGTVILNKGFGRHYAFNANYT